MAKKIDTNTEDKKTVKNTQDVQKENDKALDTEKKVEETKKKEDEPQKKEDEPKKKAPKANKDGEIPVQVDEILRAFKNYDKLFIDNQGGVFPEDSAPHLIEGLTLYFNPYFE